MYGTLYACRYDGSKALTVLVFRGGGNSIFSTTDYCTVELASASKLTQFAVSDKRKGISFLNDTPRTSVRTVNNDNTFPKSNTRFE